MNCYLYTVQINISFVLQYAYLINIHRMYFYSSVVSKLLAQNRRYKPIRMSTIKTFVYGHLVEHLVWWIFFYINLIYMCVCVLCECLQISSLFAVGWFICLSLIGIFVGYLVHMLSKAEHSLCVFFWFNIDLIPLYLSFAPFHCIHIES